MFQKFVIAFVFMLGTTTAVDFREGAHVEGGKNGYL